MTRYTYDLSTNRVLAITKATPKSKKLWLTEDGQQIVRSYLKVFDTAEEAHQALSIAIRINQSNKAREEAEMRKAIDAYDNYLSQHPEMLDGGCLLNINPIAILNI